MTGSIRQVLMAFGPPLQYWLLMIGIFLFSIYLLWDAGFLITILSEDITRISLAIIVVLFLTSLFAGVRALSLSIQINRFELIRSRSGASFVEGDSAVFDYLEATNGDTEKTLLSEVMAETLRGSHQVGWFISGLILKAGLLGTVVGFVIMLSSISGLENMDISDIKDLMEKMTQGMGVAMNTTMVGLVSSIMLSLQFLLLDRCADRLILNAVSYESSLSVSLPEKNLREE